MIRLKKTLKVINAWVNARVDTLRNFSVALFVMGTANVAYADLPTIPAPGEGDASDNWIETAKGYFSQGATFIGLALSTCLFVWAAHATFAKFHDARAGKAEWADVGLVGGVAAALLVFSGFLLNRAADVMA
jgi:integrating conjugative element membrane protein (TIGR03745 family)